MLRISQFALQSESPRVIQVASDLSGDLLFFAGAENGDWFIGFLDVEEQLLRKQDGDRETYPSIVRAIAAMFEGVEKDGKNQELIAPLESRLFALMQFVRGVPIDASEEVDSEYANSLYWALAHLYRVFAVLYHPLRGGEQTEELLRKEKVCPLRW
jgi:hypothetical protein